MTSQEALNKLAHKFAVTRNNIHTIKGISKAQLDFQPTVMRVNGNFTEQSVHLVFGNGKVKYYAVPSIRTYGYQNLLNSVSDGNNLGKALGLYENVEKVVVYINSAREGRELLVYDIEKEKSTIANYRDSIN